MRKNIYRTLYLIPLAALFLCSSCEEEYPDETTLLGTVANILDDEPVHPAFLILGDELLASSDENGVFELTSFEPGVYSILCSAIGFHDETIIIEVKEGKITHNDFHLTPGNRKGSVYGELHDQSIYKERLIADPSMANWSDGELFDGVSGATIQTMTFGYDLPPSELYIGDSLFSLTDGFGQYWFEVQAGTYPLSISSPGYRDSTMIIKVEPDTSIFGNFILKEK
jgi:hypothetical protein